jgi:PKD repeat protein
VCAVGTFALSDGPPIPVADFTVDPEVGRVPLTVKFTDQSQGDPISWLWDFGDGSISTDEHPSHIYTEASMYTVTLTVSNGAGSDTLVDVNCVEVLLQAIYLPVINKPLSVLQPSGVGRSCPDLRTICTMVSEIDTGRLGRFSLRL